MVRRGSAGMSGRSEQGDSVKPVRASGAGNGGRRQPGHRAGCATAQHAQTGRSHRSCSLAVTRPSSLYCFAFLLNTAVMLDLALTTSRSISEVNRGVSGSWDLRMCSEGCVQGRFHGGGLRGAGHWGST